VADPRFDRTLLPTIGRLLIPQDSLVKSHGKAFTVFCIVVYPCGCRSPSGNLVLTKLTRSIKVWTEVWTALHPSLRPLIPMFRKACVTKL
jgi:hypothetical protein